MTTRAPHRHIAFAHLALLAALLLVAPPAGALPGEGGGATGEAAGAEPEASPGPPAAPAAKPQAAGENGPAATAEGPANPAPPPAATGAKCRHAFCDRPAEPGSPFCSSHGNSEENKGDGWNCPACGWWVNKGSGCNNPACPRRGEGDGGAAGDGGRDGEGSPRGRDPGAPGVDPAQADRYHRKIKEKMDAGFFLPAKRKHRHVPSVF